eukprot:2798190-Heterocapsa_arctica.AAC.1
MLMPRPAGERRASRRLGAWRPRYRSMASFLPGFQLMLRLKAAKADRNEPTMALMAVSSAAGVEAMMPMASSLTKVTSTSGSAVSDAATSA